MINKTVQYETVLFKDVWDDVDEFIEEYHDVGIPAKLTDTDTTTLFWLLFARYGNNPIANMDIDQWKYKVFSIIFMYGPTWAKRLDIQDKLRALTDNDILQGSKAIYNKALNPGTAPDTQSLEALTYINEQNTTNYKRSKLEAYGQLWELLDTDVTNEFLGKFLSLFKKFVRPEKPLIYITETEDEE